MSLKGKFIAWADGLEEESIIIWSKSTIEDGIGKIGILKVPNSISTVKSKG